MCLSTVRKVEWWLQKQWQLSNKGFKVEPKLQATIKKFGNVWTISGYTDDTEENNRGDRERLDKQ